MWLSFNRDSKPFLQKNKIELWSVEFNNYLKPTEPNIFAVAGGPYCLIFKATLDGTIELITGLQDPDVRFYIYFRSFKSRHEY